MTKEEAEKKLSEHTSKSIGFCPIINNECRTDCVCFVSAQVTADTCDKKKYYFFPEYCASPLVLGVVGVESQ